MNNEIRLIVRADDFGILHSCNMAVMKAFKEGILTCASIIAPAPWAPEAAEMAKSNPDWCIGVHLCVVGEWRGYRWRPVLPYDKVPTIVDEDGFLYRFPQEFFRADPDFSEVKSELKAQIELLKKWGVKPCYLDIHYVGYGKQTGKEEEFYKVVKELSNEYDLPISDGTGENVLPGVYTVDPRLKEGVLANQLEGLTPGLWLLISHLLVNSFDARALVHTEPAHVIKEGVARHRSAELRCLISPRIKEIISRKGIKLVNYCMIREK